MLSRRFTSGMNETNVRNVWMGNLSDSEIRRQTHALSGDSSFALISRECHVRTSLNELTERSFPTSPFARQWNMIPSAEVIIIKHMSPDRFGPLRAWNRDEFKFSLSRFQLRNWRLLRLTRVVYVLSFLLLALFGARNKQTAHCSTSHVMLNVRSRGFPKQLRFLSLHHSMFIKRILGKNSSDPCGRYFSFKSLDGVIGLKKINIFIFFDTQIRKFSRFNWWKAIKMFLIEKTQ